MRYGLDRCDVSNRIVAVLPALEYSVTEMSVSRSDIEDCVLRLLRERAATSSICPSDVARALADDEAAWRALMPVVRQVASALAIEGRIIVTQGSATVHPDAISHGPIRLRRGPTFEQAE